MGVFQAGRDGLQVAIRRDIVTMNNNILLLLAEQRRTNNLLAKIVVSSHVAAQATDHIARKESGQ